MKLVGVINLTPDSFWASSRVSAEEITDRAEHQLSRGAVVLDIGAVSTRPGASAVSLEQEWSRLEPGLIALKKHFGAGLPALSIDTVRSEIIRRSVGIVGPVMVNDISAGEEDPRMLPLVGQLGLQYVAMHKRGSSTTMDSLCDYTAFATPEFPSGVIPAIISYFRDFAAKAAEAGVRDWILDPGLGFAKTPAQCWEILENLPALSVLGRPLYIGAADKRFTLGDNSRACALAEAGGAQYLRVH